MRMFLTRSTSGLDPVGLVAIVSVPCCVGGMKHVPVGISTGALHAAVRAGGPWRRRAGGPVRQPRQSRSPAAETRHSIGARSYVAGETLAETEGAMSRLETRHFSST